MSKRLFLLFIAGCMAMIYSCEYEPKEVFERKIIENPEEPIVESVNLDLEADTIYMRYSQYFMYDFSSNNRIQTVRFTLDGREVYIGNSLCTSFSIGGWLSGNGTHTLVAEVYVSSGSESLADIVGGEGYVMTKSWTIKMNQRYASQTDAKAIDGYLNITWPTYTGEDFVDYSIYRNIGNTLTLLKRQTTEGYIDQSYVGEGSQYVVRVNLKDYGQLAWGDIYLQSEIPKAGLIAKEDNQYYFAWDKSKYYRAVNAYKVIQDNYYSTAKVVKTTQDANDTTYHITTALFGDRANLTLEVVPGQSNHNYGLSTYNQYYSSNQWGYVGHPLASFTYYNVNLISQLNGDEFVYHLNDDSIRRYSTIMKKGVEKKSIKTCGGALDMSISSQKTYLGILYSCNKSLRLINPTNFNESTSYDLSNIGRTIDDPVVSDNKMAVVNDYERSFVYDLTNQKLLGTYNTAKSGYLSQCKAISSDGKYLFLNDNSYRLLKFQAPNFTQIWVYTGPNYFPKYFEFHALNPEQLAYWDGQSFSIKQCSDFSTVYDFALTDESLLNIDYYNNKMLCYKKGHLIVRSLLNGDLLHDIPVNLTINDLHKTCYLMNDVIVSENGMMYFLN